MKIVPVGIVVMAAAMAALSVTGTVFAADEPASGEAVEQVQDPEAKKSPLEDMTVAELAEHITVMIDHAEEVLECIPGLKREKDTEGVERYTLDGVRLDSLEKKKLVSLYMGVVQERGRLSTERINRQLTQIDQANRAAEIARQTASRAQAIVAPPPPQPPRPPQPPPQVPRVPPSPARR